MKKVNYWLGKHHSEETKKKMSLVRKGIHLSAETCKRISLAHEGISPSPETRRKLSLSGKGREFSVEHRRKIGEANKKRIYSPETKRKMSNARKGKKMSLETKKKISASIRRENHYNWQGGKEFELYAIDWTETLRRSIRERDHYICQLCGELQGDRAHNVHHIDYNKMNSNPQNLITLCVKCHGETSQNKKYWTNLFAKGQQAREQSRAIRELARTENRIVGLPSLC